MANSCDIVDDGIITINIKGADGESRSVNVDAFLVGAALSDVAKESVEQSLSKAEYLQKVQEVLTRYNMPGLSAKAAVEVQNAIIAASDPVEKKSSETQMPAGEPESLSSTTSIPSSFPMLNFSNLTS